MKLFSNQAFESRQYAKAIADYQRTEYKLLASLNILNVAQSVIIFLGLASGLTVCARVRLLLRLELAPGSSLARMPK